VALRCKFGHNHPPEPLKGATRNPSRRGARPYHCSECSEINKAHAVNANWLVYPDIPAAERGGHPRACSLCFPGTESGQSTVQSAVRVGRVTLDELTTWRRQLLRILDALDCRNPSGLGPAARVGRLRSAGRIPRDTTTQMLMVIEARNIAEYEDRSPTSAGAEAVRHAWAAILEWARAKGIGDGNR
jgi:hypothetical protein